MSTGLTITGNLLDWAKRDTAGTFRRITKAGKRGEEWHGPCPRCGGSQRFRVWLPEDRRHNFHCRDCEWGGDDIQYRRDHYGESYWTAARACGKDVAAPSEESDNDGAPEAVSAPPADWMTSAQDLMDRAMDVLWSAEGERARQWLHGRGLTEQTIAEAQLGFIPEDLRPLASAWGLEPRELPGGEVADQLWIPRGIVFPYHIGGDIWKLVVRRAIPKGSKAAKYIAISGGSNALYRADDLSTDLPAIIVEGTIDALAVHQAAGDLVAAVAAGTSWARRLRWISRLSLCPVVLCSHDNDGERKGEAAAAWWADRVGPHAVRWRPILKDPGEMLEKGLDVREWVVAGLEMAGYVDQVAAEIYDLGPGPGPISAPPVAQAAPDPSALTGGTAAEREAWLARRRAAQPAQMVALRSRAVRHARQCDPEMAERYVQTLRYYGYHQSADETAQLIAAIARRPEPGAAYVLPSRRRPLVVLRRLSTSRRRQLRAYRSGHARAAVARIERDLTTAQAAAPQRFIHARKARPSKPRMKAS